MSDRALRGCSPAVIEALKILRARYQALPADLRPQLTKPPDYAVLLPPERLMVLALARKYPLTKALQRWVAEPPAVAAERQARKGQTARKEARKVLVQEGPGWLDRELKKRGLCAKSVRKARQS